MQRFGKFSDALPGVRFRKLSGWVSGSFKRIFRLISGFVEEMCADVGRSCGDGVHNIAQSL